ncbi:hypothetical protein KQX54_021422 [Cotesia glomerata]|uniref:Uncharacterized protein n=1 Tax=Cotesia glomerata TaxID=32391 RepID=A0AAV7J9A6_COTGL|nr:hypothetical protein KQX54_021422 [Cotesia glomerata]
MAAEGRIGGGKSRRRRRRDARASLSHSSNSTHFTYCPRQLLPILTRLPPTLALTFPTSHVLCRYNTIPSENKEQHIWLYHDSYHIAPLRNERHHPSNFSNSEPVNHQIADKALQQEEISKTVISRSDL